MCGMCGMYVQGCVCGMYVKYVCVFCVRLVCVACGVLCVCYKYERYLLGASSLDLSRHPGIESGVNRLVQKASLSTKA